MVSNNNLLISSESVKYNSQNNNQPSQHTIKICCFLNAKKRNPNPKYSKNNSVTESRPIICLGLPCSHLDYNIGCPADR